MDIVLGKAGNEVIGGVDAGLWGGEGFANVVVEVAGRWGGGAVGCAGEE